MEFRRSRSASKLTSGSSNPNNKYEIGEMLGQGQFGKVYKAYLKDQKMGGKGESIFAIKIIPMGKLKKNAKLKQLLTNQIKILGSLKHEHIIKFEQLFAWEEKIYMVYQYCQGGSLEDILPLSEAKALSIFTKIIKACSFAQKNNVLHRDLKPANILFKDGQPRVADWGFSRYLKEQFTATSFVGSPAYMAPQLLNGSEYTSKADVWSLGVMLYECLFNQMPWSARNIKDLLIKLTTMPLRYPKEISPIFKTILKLSLEVDPQKRPTFQKLYKTLQLSKRATSSTESYENPEESSRISELSQSDIRKCSYYLQFAKQVQKFEDHEAKSMVLELILNNLRKIRDQYRGDGLGKGDSFMTPCYSQRKMSLTKREARSPRTINRSTKRESGIEQSQTHALLNKQILLIKKIQKTIPPSLHSPNQPTLIKQLIKKLIHSVSLSPTRRQLIQMNCILEIIMYEELSQEGKEKKLGEKIREMGELGIAGLVRIVNCRVLYVNQRYCKGL